MRNTMTLLADHRKSAMAVLVIALLAATFFITGGDASADDTTATATDLGNWDTNTTEGEKLGEGLGGTDRVNYYEFDLTEEKYVDIKAVDQDYKHAKMSIVDADDNTIFKSDRETTRGGPGDRSYEDRLAWKVIGPGTWYIKIAQEGTTTNHFKLNWKVKDAPAFVNDDFAAGIWTTGVVPVGGSADGTIASLPDKKDYDWFALELENWGWYTITVKPRGSDNKRRSGILRDEYGQFFEFRYDGKVHIDTRKKNRGGPPKKFFLEVRGVDGTYRVNVSLPRNYSEPDGVDFDSDHWGYVRVGSAVEGYREDPNDDDEFRTHLTAGRIYRFEVRAAEDPNDPDDKWTSGIPSVALWNLSPTTLLGTHNPFNGENAVVEYDITETDTYQIITNTNYHGGTAGTYQLKVTDITDEINNAINNQPQTSSEPPGGDVTSADPGYVRVGDSVTGYAQTTSSIRDTDYFRTLLRYGKTYRFEVKGSGDPSGQWTFGDPSLDLFKVGDEALLGTDNPVYRDEHLRNCRELPVTRARRHIPVGGH